MDPEGGGDGVVREGPEARLGVDSDADQLEGRTRPDSGAAGGQTGPLDRLSGGAHGDAGVRAHGGAAQAEEVGGGLGPRRGDHQVPPPLSVRSRPDGRAHGVQLV